MIELRELITAIKLAEACPCERLPSVVRASDLKSEPPTAERAAFNAFIESLADVALSDLHALMYAGRGDGSFISMLDHFAPEARASKVRAILGKRPEVIARYWRRAVKKHPEEA